MAYNETVATIVGHVATEITVRNTADGKNVADFRVCTSERRFNKQLGLWEDGDRFFLSVSCWGWMAVNAQRSLSKGDPVVVTGRLSMRQYETANGESRTSLDLTARAIGPDLASCVAEVSKPKRDPVSDGQLPLEATMAA